MPLSKDLCDVIATSLRFVYVNHCNDGKIPVKNR